MTYSIRRAHQLSWPDQARVVPAIPDFAVNQKKRRPCTAVKSGIPDFAEMLSDPHGFAVMTDTGINAAASDGATSVEEPRRAEVGKLRP